MFTGQPHLAEFAEGVGTFLPHPVDIPRLVASVDKLLARKGDLHALAWDSPQAARHRFQRIIQ